MISLCKSNKVLLIVGQPLRLGVIPTNPYAKSSKMLRRNFNTLLAVQYRHRGFPSKFTPLVRLSPFQNPTTIQSRNVGMFVGRILRGVLKIRYLLIGGAVGGGVTLQRVTFFFMKLYFKYLLLT